MPDLEDGETFEMQGSGANPYILKNTGGVYSCNCPAWRNQRIPIERRTCKHLRHLRGEEAEAIRCTAPAGEAETPKSATAVGETAPDIVLLAHAWEEKVDPSGWWMSEKFDGVRGVWDGTQFLTRKGGPLRVPEWFLAGFPSFSLDGELWLDRGRFNEGSGIVRRYDQSDHWRAIRFLIFDAPKHPGPFEERISLINEYVFRVAPPYARPVPQVRCQNVDHLRAELARVEALKGEGLMLRKPGSKYVVGRSATCLKVKSWFDEEATVLGYQKGKGKHKGRMGAVMARLADGTEFEVGTGFTDADRENPPPIGSVIVVRYQELTPDGKPRFPTYQGMRVEPLLASR